MRRPPEATIDRAGAPGFEAFYAEEYRRLVKALFLLVGDQTEAEEVAQEALTRVFERWDQVRGMDSPVGYAYRVAFNLNRRRVRALRRGRPSVEPATGCDDPADRANLQEDVIRAVRALPVATRQTLIAAVWLGLGTDELARIFGVRHTYPGNRLGDLHGSGGVARGEAVRTPSVRIVPGGGRS